MGNDGKFYFLEMNTRIQVEHPVTELITGVDIVREQVSIASGNKLSLKQKNISMMGHAVEARVYAENPLDNFRPSPGKISIYLPPNEKELRIDTFIQTGNEINQGYDSMIAKVVVHAPDRQEAIHRLYTKLDNTIIHGIEHNIEFLKSILKHDDYKKNKLSTSFIDHNLPDLIRFSQPDSSDIRHIFLAAGIVVLINKSETRVDHEKSVWEKIGLWRSIIKIPFGACGKISLVEIPAKLASDMELYSDGEKFSLSEMTYSKHHIAFISEGKLWSFIYSTDSYNKIWLSYSGHVYSVIRKDMIDPDRDFTMLTADKGNEKNIFSPIHGKIIKVMTKQNDVIKKDDPLVIIESMKIENRILSPASGIVKQIHVREGVQVQVNMLMVEID